MIKKLVLILLVVLLAGCYKDAEISTQVNGNFNVEELFTHKGCTIFRFGDGGRAHYYTNCIRGSSEVTDSWTESCGKNCNSTHNEEVPTNYRD